MEHGRPARAKAQIFRFSAFKSATAVSRCRVSSQRGSWKLPPRELARL